MQASSGKRVVIIGGGITGLAAAHRLHQLDPRLDISLLEAQDRLGGVLHTIRGDGFLIEQSADNFVSDVPAGMELCRLVGLGEELLPTQGARRSALVVCRGRLEPVPRGFSLMAPGLVWPVLTSTILSPLGKFRLLAERFVPRRRETSDESLASFARRRLGREAYERIVQPLVGGIYTADPEKLSLAATLPRFIDMEERHGSLSKAARLQAATSAVAREASGARYSLFVAPRDGLSSLVTAIANRLPKDCVRLGTPVKQVVRLDDGSWAVKTGATGESTIRCDALIVALGADVAGGLLGAVDIELASMLKKIPYASSVVVSLGFRRESIGVPLDGFGFVVPAIENRCILAGSFASLKFPGRAPDGTVLVRAFVGGACQGELVEESDESLLRIVLEELRSLLAIRGEPLVRDVARWRDSMPQYHLGHLELVARIEQSVAKIERLALAGNAYHGVGIPHCIASGQQAAARVMAQLTAR